MTIISFSNAAAQPFLAASVKALAPWFSLFRNAVGRTVPTVASKSEVCPANQALASTAECFAVHPTKEFGHEHLPCKTKRRSGLRVVREFDSAVGPDCAGRMVISGRMADVCAELDRMALQGSITH